VQHNWWRKRNTTPLNIAPWFFFYPFRGACVLVAYQVEAGIVELVLCGSTLALQVPTAVKKSQKKTKRL
jgi:hypothetical protein